MARLVTVKCLQGSPHIFVATPTYTGQVGQSYVASMATSIPLLASAGIGLTYCSLGFNCHVDDARNTIVREFMKSEADALIFLDSDIGWRAEDLLTLALHNKDVVGGVYPKKADGEDYPVYVIPGKELYADENGLVEVEGLPTGFLKITRHAIEIMHEKYGDRKYRGQNDKPDDPPYVILFERTFENGARWSGDYAFCRKWAETGGKMYVDPEMYFSHEGIQEWSGSLGNFWKNKHGIAEQEREQKFSEAIERLKSGEPDGDTIKDLIKGWGNTWSGQTELITACIDLARESDGPILECGSGLTSLVLGINTTHCVVTLEHNPVWASYTQAMLDKYGIKNVQILCKPLKDYGDYEWYQTPDILPVFSLVVCDGPPRQINGRPIKGGRTGITRLSEKIRNAILVLDDPAEDMISLFKEQLGAELHIVGSEKPFAVGRLAA